jgi:hypothetical protein
MIELPAFTLPLVTRFESCLDGAAPLRLCRTDEVQCLGRPPHSRIVCELQFLATIRIPLTRDTYQYRFWWILITQEERMGVKEWIV